MRCHQEIDSRCGDCRWFLPAVGGCGWLPPVVLQSGPNVGETAFPACELNTRACSRFGLAVPCRREELVASWSMSARTRNCLDVNQFETKGQVADKTADQLLEMKNFGRRCLDEVRALLRADGLGLKGDP